MNICIDKRGQHEIAGFVLIVLIVSIIGVVFLSLSFAKESYEPNSFEISNLLEASMYKTSDCGINFIPQYRNMQDLIKECDRTQSGDYRECLVKVEGVSDGAEVLTEKKDICLVLEEDLKKVIDEGLLVGEGAVNRAYKMDIYFSYGDESNPNEEIISFSSGVFKNCSSIVGGRHSIAAGSSRFGTIESELRVCK